MQLIYERTPSVERVLLVDKERLLEVDERFVDQLTLGTIIEATVDRVHPSLDAAFLSAGDETFYLPLAETLHALERYPEKGTIRQACVIGEKKLVQVTKEGIGGKKHKVTENIHFGGRYLVYFPKGRRVLFSRKLDLIAQEKLRNTIELVGTEGVLYRTEAGGASAEELLEEWALLRGRAEVVMRDKRGQDELLCEAVVRRHPVTRALVNDTDAQQRLKRLGVDVERFVGKGRMQEAIRFDDAVEQLGKRVVWLSGGAYLLIEQVETMTVIDVNSGKNATVKGKEESADAINEAAAYALLEQLRLRNIGGMVVVDFLRGTKNGREQIVRRMKELGVRERRRIEVYGFTRMGLFELSRERTGRSFQDRMTYQGEPSKLAVFSKVERGLMEVAPHYEAVVLSLPSKWWDGAWRSFDVDVYFVEGTQGLVFMGSSEDCQNFSARH